MCVTPSRRDRAGISLVLASFALSVLSKPMTITLPLLLLLLDVWPLRRLPLHAAADYDRKPRIAAISWREALREKVPFLAIAAGAGLVTYLVQSSRGDIKAFSQYSLGLRAANAVVSYIVYIAKMFWPTRLAVFYPFPADMPRGKWLRRPWHGGHRNSGVALVSSFPLPGLGWFWYLVTLAPVIGLVQVGETARAYGGPVHVHPHGRTVHHAGLERGGRTAPLAACKTGVHRVGHRGMRVIDRA